MTRSVDLADATMSAIEAFLAKGGAVQQIPVGEKGVEHIEVRDAVTIKEVVTPSIPWFEPGAPPPPGCAWIIPGAIYVRKVG